MASARGTFEIVPVGPSGLPAFVELSWSLVPAVLRPPEPLRGMMLHELQGKDAFARYGTIKPFLCLERGAPVGRIAGLLNPRLRDEEGRVIGQLGYFECVEDPAVAGALIDAGCAWLASQGCRTVLGPMNGGAHRRHRFMTEGFDSAPFPFEPRNPAYYPSLFEASGFRAMYTWTSHELTRERIEGLYQRVRRVAERRKAVFVVEFQEPWSLPEVNDRVYRLFGKAWDGHMGYAPFEREELFDIMAPALSLMSPQHMPFLVNTKGEDVGLAFGYPDPEPVRGVFHTAALLDEARYSSGAFQLLTHGLAHFLDHGYREGIVALSVEELKFFDHLHLPTRRYSLFGRTLSPLAL